jgi:hypothetical protein
MNVTPEMKLVAGAVAIFLTGILVGRLTSSSATPLIQTAGKAAAPVPLGEAELSRASAGSGVLDNAVTRFATCLANPTEIERHAEWMLLLQDLTPENAPAVRQLFRDMASHGRTFSAEWDAFWKRWGVIDGPGAANYALTQDLREYWARDTVGKALFGWAGRQPDAAGQWLEQHRASPAFRSAQGGYVAGVALLDYKRGTRYALEEIPAEQQIMQFAMAVATEGALQQGGLRGMLEWFDQLPDDELHRAHKQAALPHVVGRLQQAGNDRAMEWLREKAATPWRSDPSIEELSSAVARDEPQRALDWLSTLPPTADGHFSGVERAIGEWVHQDRAALEKYLPQLQPPEFREHAQAAYQKFVTKLSPEQLKAAVESAR